MTQQVPAGMTVEGVTAAQITALQDHQSALIFVPAAGANNVAPNTAFASILPTTSSVTITGGGDGLDTQLIGYTKATQYFLGAGSSYTFNALPVSGNVSDLKLTRKISDGTVAVLTYVASGPTGTQWTGTISGGTVAITLGTALNSGEYIRAEDPYAAIATPGQAPSYGSIHGGYDNSIQSGLMNHIVSSAHSHIDDQDGTPGHTMIFGGSAHYITGSIAYSAILGGTGNEMRSGAGNGSVILGGLYSKVSGTTAAVLAGERCKVTATYGIASGQGQTVSGTASVALGRGHTVSGANALAIGQGNTVSSDNSIALGNTGTVNSSNAYSALMGGYKARSVMAGNSVNWAYRDSSVGTNPLIQDDRIYMGAYFSDQSTHLLPNHVDGVTTDIPVTAGSMTTYQIRVEARGGNIRGGWWTLTAVVQAPAVLAAGTPAVIVAQSVDFSYVDPGLGAGANAVDVSLSINASTGAALNITVKQRVDSAVGTKWSAIVSRAELA